MIIKYNKRKILQEKKNKTIYKEKKDNNWSN